MKFFLAGAFTQPFGGFFSWISLVSAASGRSAMAMRSGEDYFALLKLKTPLILLLIISVITGFSTIATADCENVGGSNYQCSGATTTAQTINAANAAVTTASGFNLASETTGLFVTGTGALSYTDNYGSPLAAAAVAVLNFSSSGTGGSINIKTSGLLTGGSTAIAINLANSGDGAISVDTTGGTVTGSFGINAANSSAAGTDLLVHATDVTGNAGNAIVANNQGSGRTVVTSNGSIVSTGAGSNGIGIQAVAGTSTVGGLEIDAVNVNGASLGISATNQGGGVTNVSATGTVQSARGRAISVISNNNNAPTNGTGATVITSGAVTGFTQAIYVSNGGTNANSTGVHIIADGPVVSLTSAAITGQSIAPISGIPVPTTGGITIQSSQTVTGATTGVIALNRGLGDTSVTATGLVTGTTVYGIQASNGSIGGNLTVNAGDVNGRTAAIGVDNEGTGLTTVTSDGTLTSAAGYGIQALAGATTVGGLGVNAVNVNGATGGISATNAGGGKTNVSTTGVIQSSTGQAISVIASNGGASTAGTGVNVNTSGSVTGATDGIAVLNSGTNANATGIRIETDGTVQGQGGVGISAQANIGAVGGIAVKSSQAVAGATNGIDADNAGLGDTRVVATGLVTGSSGYGIRAQNGATAGNLMVDSQDANGSLFGIYTVNSGMGSTNITSRGSVEGGSGAISASSSGQAIDIVNDGSVQNLSGTSDALAVITNGGPATITNSNLLTGVVQLGSGSVNQVINEGTWNTGGGTNDLGGAGIVDNRQLINAADLNSNSAQTTTFNGLATFLNSGIVNMQNGLTGDRTLITGNFVGQGGTVKLDTVLGSDGSSSDLLVMNGGMASGISSLKIVNTSGLGALTVANGILVVDTINGGTTASGAFSLAAPAIAGPYEYSLFRGSVDASNPDAWYLRSELNCQLDPSSPLCPQPSPNPTPNPVNYRAETSLYAALPSMTLLYGRTLLDTMHERMGDEAAAPGGGAPNAAWGRIIGQHGDHDGSAIGVYGSGGPAYEYNSWAVQAGSDLYRDGGKSTAHDRAGAFFAIGQGWGDVDHIGTGKAGSNSFGAYSGGVYFTHFTPSNAYIDTVLMGTFYDADAQSDRIPKLKTQGGGFGASLEGGTPLQVGGGWVAEPQAQLTFQTIDLNNSSDVAALVDFDNANSLMGRLGVRFVHDFVVADIISGQSGSITAWVRPNFWYEFLGDQKTSFSSDSGYTPFSSDLGGATFEINTGFEAALSSSTSLYANGSYLIGLGDAAGGSAYDGKLGIKVAW